MNYNFLINHLKSQMFNEESRKTISIGHAVDVDR